MTRRSFLSSFSSAPALLGGLLSTTPARDQDVPSQDGLPASGEPSRYLEPLDAAMHAFLSEHRIPGGALALLHNGRLVYARGFGYIDPEKRAAFLPTTPFRYGSIAKPITAVGVMRLWQEGRLDLDDPAFRLIGTEPLAGQVADPRLGAVTVRHLLHHTGGWDRDKSFDPAAIRTRVAREMGVPAPATEAQLVRWMAGKPLDFDPGTRYAYSNFGYVVLGRVIEKVTGQGYGDYIRQNVLAPMGADGIRLEPGTSQWLTDGTRRFEWVATDACGGWMGSLVDLARFARGVERNTVLSRRTFRQMLEPPAPPVASPDPSGRVAGGYYGLGWMDVAADPATGAANYVHGGVLPQAISALWHRQSGLTGIVFLRHPWMEEGVNGKAMVAVDRAAAEVTRWPTKDLLSQ